jgi:hypothetical protein
MRKSLSLTLLAALPLLALPGCSNKDNQSGTYPSALSGAAAAASIASLASPDVPIFQVGTADTLSSDNSGGTPMGPGPCQFDGASGQFGCADARKGNVNLTRKVIFRDADGNVQSSFDKTTTASVEVQTSADGTTSRPGGGTATIHRTGDMITSGLAGEETTHTLNGTEQGTVDGAWTLPDGTMATESTTISDSTHNLVIPVPAKSDGMRPGGPGAGLNVPPPFPLSGSRTHATTTTSTRGSETKTTSLTRTETFDGTGVVQVVITINGETKNCTVDLVSHTNTCGK